jgi:hypothetical protein
MLNRVVVGKQRRLIPVLYADVDELPPFLSTRKWLDLRNVDGPTYEKRVHELAAALRDQRPARPERNCKIQLPPGTG